MICPLQVALLPLSRSAAQVSRMRSPGLLETDARIAEVPSPLCPAIRIIVREGVRPCLSKPIQQGMPQRVYHEVFGQSQQPLATVNTDRPA